MGPINTYEAKRHFSSLLKKVIGGETVIIASHNKPIAELRPVQKQKKNHRPKAGLCKGQFRVPDDFNEPLSDDLLNLFYS